MSVQVAVHLGEALFTGADDAADGRHGGRLGESGRRAELEAPQLTARFDAVQRETVRRPFFETTSGGLGQAPELPDIAGNGFEAREDLQVGRVVLEHRFRRLGDPRVRRAHRVRRGPEVDVHVVVNRFARPIDAVDRDEGVLAITARA